MEKRKPRILVFTVSAWNKKVGSNTWASLLEQYDSDAVANLCIRDEQPDSRVCSRYFAISENKVLKSIVNRRIITGKEMRPCDTEDAVSEDLEQHNARYRKMKQHRRYSMLLAREIVWKLGKWRTKELDEYLDSFQPDIILHSMEGYIHLNRIIRYAINRTGAKAIGYIWDDNFTYKQSRKPGYKFYRFFQRRSLKRLAKQTSAFFAISDLAKMEADAFFGIDCKILTKPLNQQPVVRCVEMKAPLRMLYTGNLLIGRDRSLCKLVQVINKLPENMMTLDIYTQTVLPDETRACIEGADCHIHPPIPQAQVLELQKQADVLLFLEDIDGPDAHTARLSFSTKITDYLSAGKCIFAVGCLDTAPMQYFIKNEIAITATNEEEIAQGLERILDDTTVLSHYAGRACEISLKNHSKEHILEIFNNTIEKTLRKEGYYAE